MEFIESILAFGFHVLSISGFCNCYGVDLIFIHLSVQFAYCYVHFHAIEIANQMGSFLELFL